jgi:hypothetical protein
LLIMNMFVQSIREDASPVAGHYECIPVLTGMEAKKSDGT